MNRPSAEAETAGDPRRKRLRFQCWHRGIREMDLIMGGFADRHLGGLTESELDALERLLIVPDATVYLWVSGRAAVSADHDGPLFQRLKQWVATAIHNG